MKKLPVSEKVVMSAVKDALDLYGWTWVHFQQARRANGSWATPFEGKRGFPDFAACKPGRMIYLELKGTGGKTSSDQDEWLELLSSVPGVEAHLITPGNMACLPALLGPRRDDEPVEGS